MPRRSVLYVPADRDRVRSKAETLDCDAIVFDLEDAVAPEARDGAREALRGHFADHPTAKTERIIRINGLCTPWGTEDLLAARACQPDAILLPKVAHADDVLAAADALDQADAPDSVRLWAMIETPQAVINAALIAEIGLLASSRLDCLVIGTNDLFKAAGLVGPDARLHAHGWLMQIVLAARAGGLDVLDGVYNDYADADGFAAQCRQAAAMGFDGKTLIHPLQIEPANAAFAPDPDAISAAQRIIAAFETPENRDKAVLTVDGAMVERLHCEQARALIARADAIAARDRSKQP